MRDKNKGLALLNGVNINCHISCQSFRKDATRNDWVVKHLGETFKRCLMLCCERLSTTTTQNYSSICTITHPSNWASVVEYVLIPIHLLLILLIFECSQEKMLMMTVLDCLFDVQKRTTQHGCLQETNSHRFVSSVWVLPPTGTQTCHQKCGGSWA